MLPVSMSFIAPKQKEYVNDFLIEIGFLHLGNMMIYCVKVSQVSLVQNMFLLL